MVHWDFHIKMRSNTTLSLLEERPKSPVIPIKDCYLQKLHNTTNDFYEYADIWLQNRHRSPTLSQIPGIMETDISTKEKRIEFIKQYEHFFRFHFRNDLKYQDSQTRAGYYKIIDNITNETAGLCGIIIHKRDYNNKISKFELAIFLKEQYQGKKIGTDAIDKYASCVLIPSYLEGEFSNLATCEVQTLKNNKPSFGIQRKTGVSAAQFTEEEHNNIKITKTTVEALVLSSLVNKGIRSVQEESVNFAKNIAKELMIQLGGEVLSVLR